jgi:hypothetical protein
VEVAVQQVQHKNLVDPQQVVVEQVVVIQMELLVNLVVQELQTLEVVEVVDLVDFQIQITQEQVEQVALE